MKRRNLILSFLASGFFIAIATLIPDLATAQADKVKADVLLRNGKIYTADPARSIRQAIAIKGNTIVAVGDDDEVGR
jgi:hypothetical protein